MSQDPSPRRVFHVIARLNIGGPAIHVALVASGLKSMNYEVEVITGCVGPREGDMEYYVKERGITPLILEDLGREIRPIADLRLIGRLYNLFKRERPDVVHTHTAKAGAIARIAAWLAGVPVVVHTFHGHVLRGYFGPLKTRFFLTVERMLARITHAIITLGDRQREEIVGFGIATSNRITVLPLGLDLDPFLLAPRRPGSLRQRIGLDSGTPLFGIVARLVPIKRHEDFFHALASFRSAQTPFACVVAGDGERRGELEALATALEIDHLVHFLGWEKDMSAIYPDLDALVLTSANEGLPTAIIEAMASAVPVVSTRVGSVPDMVQDGREGYLVEAGDREGIAAALGRIIECRDRADAMGEAGRKSAREQYSAQRMCHDLDLLYGRLLHPSTLT